MTELAEFLLALNFFGPTQLECNRCREKGQLTVKLTQCSAEVTGLHSKE
jgi:hypothetical protein